MEEYEVKKDCFGYRSVCKCSALKQMYCSVEHCRFYKTAEQFKRDRKDTCSWEPENSISVLEYLERLKGVDAGGQEKT